MASSWFKRAHRLHSLAQPVGTPYRRGKGDGNSSRTTSDDRVAQRFSELRSRVQDPIALAKMLCVSPDLFEAWCRGERIQLLRAHRAAIDRAINTTAEHKPKPSD